MRLYIFGQGRKSTERTCVHGERAHYGEWKSHKDKEESHLLYFSFNQGDYASYSRIKSSLLLQKSTYYINILSYLRQLVTLFPLNWKKNIEFSKIKVLMLCLSSGIFIFRSFYGKYWSSYSSDLPTKHSTLTLISISVKIVKQKQTVKS